MSHYDRHLSKIETARALILIALPVAALVWLILQVGAVFPADVTRDGWYALVGIFVIVL